MRYSHLPNIRERANMILAKIISVVISSCAALLAEASLLAQESRRIHYGTTTSSTHLPVWVAKDAGFFSKSSLNVEPVQIRGGSLITMAIMSGQLQFSGAGAESVVAARIEGGDVVLLACPVNSDPVYLIARPEIKSAAELKCKATAVTRLGEPPTSISAPPSDMSASTRKRTSRFCSSEPAPRLFRQWKRDAYPWLL